ncbi:site-specific integrase [Capillimicrobium parvum]|uniref:site-specific integrase n=1 Tax=Capillimicrobium parvum TaxID=2884022 RepID=UPI00216B302F|nr:tyrosine-type recombinase/integrase [Capillimicrobium parvum]
MRRIFGVVNAVMRLAAQRGYVAVNPCDAVEMPSKKRAGVRRSKLYLEGPGLRALADALPEHWRLPVLLDGSCGLRAGEIWALRRRDIDFIHRELTVQFALKPIESSHLDGSAKGLLVGHPKSAASRRRLSLPAGAPTAHRAGDRESRRPVARGYAVAREDPANADRADLGWTADANDPGRLLFVTPRGYPVRHNPFYRRAFKPAVRAALPIRLHGLRFHDLRHTAATLAMATPRGSMQMVKERLGLENIATTVDLYGKRIRSVDEAIADAVGASIFDEPENVVAITRDAARR